MKTLLAPTALTMALAMSNVAVASVSITETDSSFDVQVRLTNELPVALSLDADDFYRGDFQAKSNAQLRTLTSMDLYTGMGAAMVPTVRAIT